VRYEEVVIDTLYRRLVNRFVLVGELLFAQFLTGAAISKSASSAAHKTRLQPFAETIIVTDESYSVAFTSDNRSATADFVTEAAAREWMANTLANDPSLTGTLHVIPTAETSLAA
jgi:hypothetical protein